MYCFRKFLFLTLILASSVNSLSIPILSDIQDVISLARDIQNLAAGNYPFKNMVTKAKNPLALIVDMLSHIDNSVTELEDTFSHKLDEIIERILERIPLEGQISRAVDDFYDYAMRVEKLYAKFQFYVPLVNNVSQVTIEKFMDAVIGTDYGGMRDTLQQMYGLVVPDRTASETTSYFELFERRNNLFDASEMCELNETPQQQMYHYLNVMVLSEVRAFSAILFAHKLEAYYYNVTIEDEVLRAKSELVMRISDYINEARRYIQRAPRTIYRCDPPKNRKDETYIDFGNIFSLYVINEWQAWSSATCGYTCNKVDAWDTYRSASSTEVTWYQKKPCRGHIFNCFYLGGYTKICEYDSSSPFRYQWLRASGIGSYGDVGDCPGKETTDVSSSSGFYLCDYCACQCSESWSEVTDLRSFSLRPQLADVKNNMVLSNVRFIEKNTMVHLQIEQSLLLPGGQIGKNNSTWIELDEMIYSSKKSGGGFYDPNNANKWFVRGQDFQFLQRPGTYGFDIDDVLAPKGYVMTGARLRHSYPREGEFNGGNDLHLNIHISPFDFRTGKLTISDETPSMWLTPQNQPNIPEEYSKERYVLPTGGNAAPWPSTRSNFNLKPNLEIAFEPSYYGLDVGRRTVPYVDNRPVVTSNSAAMGGMGFVYRSQGNHIAFLALKLFTVDVTSYLQSEFTQDQYDFYKRLYRKKLVNEVKVSK